MAVRGPHHGDVGSNAVEPDEAVHGASLDLRLALQLQTKFVKESDSSCEVVDNNARRCPFAEASCPYVKARPAGLDASYVGVGFFRSSSI